MKCPYCLTGFHGEPSRYEIGKEAESLFAIFKDQCPSCKKFIVWMLQEHLDAKAHTQTTMILPRTTRPPCPSEVPEAIAEDYREASLVLHDSPKASAALSRRCLQSLLRTMDGVRPGDLAAEIQQVIDKKLAPSYVLDAIDAIRVVGNFAAHPIKSRATGEILPVEPGEAEWTLDVLSALFDFVYVLPAKIAVKKAALNKKLEDAGKPPMKL